MDAFLAKLDAREAAEPVEEKPVVIDRKKLEAEILNFEEQIARQEAEIALTLQKAEEAQAAFLVSVEEEAQKAADEKRAQMLAERDSAVNTRIAPLEERVAKCVEMIAAHRALLDGKE